MSTGPPRMIIVDDIDSRIQYNGPWFPDVGSQDSVGVQGPPFRSTLHGTQANASFEFAYNGTGIQIQGTSDIQTKSGVIEPTCECSIDGIRIGANPPPSEVTNNWVFCTQPSVLDGPHILTVNVTIMKNQTFWFDEIRYFPSASVPLDQETIFVGNADPQLQYGLGWQNGVTNTTGSTFTFDFIGVSISWYGDAFQGNQSSATYSIDGQTPIDFVLNGTPSSNQKYFETAQLPADPHTLKVVYQGNDTRPLSLDYLAVQNGTLPSTATSVSSHATSTTGNAVSGTSTPGNSSAPVGAIIGGAIGGLTLIVLAILGLLLLRRHKRRAAEERALVSTSLPFDFEYPALHPLSTTPNYSLPLQQSTSAIGKHVPPPLPVSRPSPLALLRRAQRKMEALAASESQRRGDTLPAMVSMQSNATRSPNVVVHEDSGIRMPPSTPATSEVMEVPPSYTAD